MESLPPSFLPKPKIDFNYLDYIVNSKEVFVNLYEIFFKKELKLYQYPFLIFKSLEKKLKNIYEECFISGDCLYGLKKINEEQIIKSTLIFRKNKNEYILLIRKCINEKIIKNGEQKIDPLTKQYIEIIIRNILISNPQLECFRDIFYLKNKKQKIETERSSIDFYPGFSTSLVETDKGLFINVILKNKITNTESILDYINEIKNIKGSNEYIRGKLIGHKFKVEYSKKNYKIDDILFDRNPKNTTLNYNGSSINLIKYYEKMHGKKIRDFTQPLILVKKKESCNIINNYFIPELCFLFELNGENKLDHHLMKEISKRTKTYPIDYIKHFEKFLYLLQNTEKTKDKNNLNTKDKLELYGIEIKPCSKLFKAYYIKDSVLKDGKNKIISSQNKFFPIFNKSLLFNWLLFYEKNDYNVAKKFLFFLKLASNSLSIKVNDPEWVEMPNESNARDWINKVDNYLNKEKYSFTFMLFLLGKNDNIYYKLKKHSLCKNGFISQFVKVNNIGLRRRQMLSIYNNILMQINSKLGGVSCELLIDKIILDRKLMIIGIDSSHNEGKWTAFGMVATTNDNFTKYYNDEEIIEDEQINYIQFKLALFIEHAIMFYSKNNKNYPRGIIIYRQGVSLHQKDYLFNEIKNIENVCNNYNINYYYILVNKKINYKFYEKNGLVEYCNPASNLLIMDGITNKNFFEFYLQPQEVTEGTAIPICYHVAYGNMNYPEIIPKLTFDLCHIYCNYQGSIKVPHVLKLAEKLAKMTSKYTHDKLNPKLGESLSYI